MARGLAVAVALIVMLTAAAPASAVTCANLQTELDNSASGGTVTIDEGSTCTGHWNLPSHPITIEGGGTAGATLLGDGTNRILTGHDTGRTIIQKLLFRGGRATGAGEDGGAIHVTGQSGLQLFNNSFFDNRANDRGGAVHLEMAKPPDGENSLGFSALGNVFGTADPNDANTATTGGAISVDSQDGINDQFSLTDNTFRSNVAQWYGGAFSYELGEKPLNGASVRLNGNDVIGNTAGGAGGGGHVTGPISQARVDNELYQGNVVKPLAGSPQGSHLGGGLYLKVGGPILRRNTFDSNAISSFPDGDLGGGGIAVPATNFFAASEFTRIVNNTVAGQPGGSGFDSEGGGLYLTGNGQWISFLDAVAGNSVGGNGEGGGIYTGAAITGTSLALFETTIAGNTSGGQFPGIAGDANDHLYARNAIVYSAGPGDIGGFADFDMQNTDACQGAGGAFAGAGNICANPLLVNPGPGTANIHQTGASPTIDAGNDDFMDDVDSERAMTDYEGDPRPTDGDGDGHTVDMGADESAAFVAQPPPGHTPQCSDGADNDGDGAIDGADPGCLPGPADDNEGDETPGDLVLCGSRDISLVRADVKGSKVELSGFVATRFAGQKVDLSVRYLGRRGRPKKLGSVTAGADGAFTGRVAKPSRKLFNLARYRAQVGSAKSVELKLPQSLASSSLRAAGGMLELRGQVDRAVLGKRNAVVVKRILCGKYTTVGQAKPDKKGRYVVRFPAPASGGSALYRAETKVLARPGSRRYVKQFARAIGITF
jgi:hypothetical protein